MPLKKALKYLHFSILAIFLIDIVLWIVYDISFNGYKIDRILFWVWFLTAIAFVATFNAKYYLFSIIGLVIITMIPMMFPFLHLISMVSFSDRKQSYELSEKLRADIYSRVMGNPTKGVLIEKGIVFEQPLVKELPDVFQMDSTNNKYLNNVKDIKLVNETNDSIVLKFKFKNSEKIISLKKE